MFQKYQEVRTLFIIFEIVPDVAITRNFGRFSQPSFNIQEAEKQFDEFEENICPYPWTKDCEGGLFFCSPIRSDLSPNMLLCS